jgi:hypothetical protein
MAEKTSMPQDEPLAFSNAVRLTVSEWLAIAIVTVIFIVCAPWLWSQVEDFALEPDYRMPHDLSNDYWLYERLAGLAADADKHVIFGDSVVWGEYVTSQQTLSHYLNEIAGRELFANLGLDGAHPLALHGLIRHYAGSITGKSVVLHCNPLWLSSAKADLRTDDRVNEFNHPRLVPQFLPSIPAYRQEISAKIGILVEQRLPFNKWTNHLQQAYYHQKDIPGWTVDESPRGREGHPYDNPLEPMTRGLPPPDDKLRHASEAWYKSGITKQDYPWIDLDTSLQWRAFRDAVQLLKRRGNRVFVLVGPFNEHMLTAASLERYRAVKAAIAAWLEDRQIPHMVPPALASAEYGDASHPLAGGYAELARRLIRQLRDS